MMTTRSGRELNRQLSRAEQGARDGPVIITDQAYPRLTGNRAKIGDLLAMDEPLELELPTRGDLPRPADFS